MPTDGSRPLLPQDKARLKAIDAVNASLPLRASMVEMARVCGSKGCRCTKGHKHKSWYVSVRHEGKRKLVYLPPEMVAGVRRRIQAYHDIEKYLDFSSDQAVREILLRKRR